MPKVVIIADDLTGANATGVLLARQGFKTATFLDLHQYDEQENSGLNVISINTDSRGVDEDTAYERVKEAVRFFQDTGTDVGLFCKRIDSTLRGNIGAEIAAVLDNLPDETIAVVVPAFPGSGRVSIGGYLMVNSVPLEKTGVARDPKSPVHTSQIVDLIKFQLRENVGFIDLAKTLRGVEAIKDALLKEKQMGQKVIVVDATTDEDISNIARAVRESKLKTVAVDPGPFSAALALQLLGQPKLGPGQKVMLTIGSITELTRVQLEEFKLNHPALLVDVAAPKLLNDQTAAAEIDRVSENLIKDIHNYNVIGVVSGGFEEEILDLKIVAQELQITEEQVSQKICNGLAKITSKVLAESHSAIGGLYTSGGDVTVAVCKELEAKGIEVKDEVIPLAVYGRISKGNYDNTPIITKGGLVGENNAICKCVDYLLTKVSNEYYLNP
ncbi:four-carbon acid sugar kinase family protein [Desulfosporosinus sp. SYSU MS00001]|uniref:four-carbon acid sugar kinase family protein n=1 Tax=Desulfosporosinus sp. SYSU MS00001 TaxID=3416284 RepID=UPI003CE70C6F